MKVRKRKGLCWEHGSTWHLLSGDEHGRPFDGGMCARCLVEIERHPADRRAMVLRHYADVRPAKPPVELAALLGAVCTGGC